VIIETCSFPDRLKEAQVTPIYKKSDPFLKNNYRPVSIRKCAVGTIIGILRKHPSIYL
jgi:hypothetical protein